MQMRSQRDKRSTVEGGFKDNESDVQCPVMFIAFLDHLSESKDMVNG